MNTPAPALAPAESRSQDWLWPVIERLQPAIGPRSPLPADPEAAWEAAAEMCGLTQEALAQQIALQCGLRFEPLPTAPSADAAKLMRLSPVLREYRAVPLRRGEDYLLLAIADPAAPDLISRLCFALGLPVDLVIAPPGPLRRLYEQAGVPLEGKPGPGTEREEAEPPAATGGGEFHLEDQPADGAVVRLCNLMLRQAMEHDASDIHVQPVGSGGLVRMRFDGLLRVMGRLPTSVMLRLVGRVKAVAGMNPTDRMHPQDAHARALWGARRVDLRIATLPVTGGEKLVMRLLGGQDVMRLDDLDLGATEMRQVLNLIESSMGVVIVAGPTGSGKTTTLYSILHEKNRNEVNIVTVEDPVEIHMPRLAQTEVNPRSGLDFANALRSVVRQDPDIILIGEIRDGETAAIALQAAITGHLVFASVHANDAVSVLPRMTELGVSNDLVAEAVRGIVSQRLVRVACPACARAAVAPWTVAESWLMAHAGLKESVRAVGCPACGGTGYRGRCSIVQVLTNTPEVARALDHGEPLSKVRELARSQGMRSLSESALDRVLRRQTTVDEVLRVLGTDFWREISAAMGVAPPLEQEIPSSAVVDERGSGAVLLVAKNEQWRETVLGWLLELGWPVVPATNEQEVREAMAHHADFAVVLVDVAEADVGRARTLMQMRESFAGAAVPLLVFESAENTELARDIGRHPHVLLAQRPQDAAALRAQIERALT